MNFVYLIPLGPKNKEKITRNTVAAIPKIKKGLKNLNGFMPEVNKTTISLSDDKVWRVKDEATKTARGIICDIIFGRTVRVNIKKDFKSAPRITISSNILRTWLSHASESIPIRTVVKANKILPIIYLSIFFILYRIIYDKLYPYAINNVNRC